MRLPIIDAGDPWWTQWFAAAGLPTDWLAQQPSARMGAQTLEASRAIAGQGVAILTASFYGPEIAAGRLYRPFDLICSDGQAYCLVYPEARRASPKVRAFRDWLLSHFPDAAA